MSPGGNWLAVGWPDADQLLFVRLGRGLGDGPGRLQRVDPVPLALVPDRQRVVLSGRVDSSVFWLDNGEAMELEELLEEGRVLLLFYLFDWSPT